MDNPKDREERIRERAYAIWYADGFPEGRHDEHWAQAERELAEQDGDAASIAPAEPAMTAPPVPGVTTASDQAKTSATPPAETKATTRDTGRRPVTTL